MNYKVTNTRVNTEPKIHAVEKVGDIYFTHCSLYIENSLYGRWEQTDKEVTCKKCLKSFQQGY